jgi:O-antigen biosynthesis protein
MSNSLSHLLMAATTHHRDSGAGIPELIAPSIEPCRASWTGNRLNLVFPAILETLTYGGVATALRFFERLSAQFEHARIVLLNQTESQFDFSQWRDWIVDDGSIAPRSIAFLGDETTSLKVSSADFFLATFWTTAVYVKHVVARQIQLFPEADRPFVYLIQDYEPAFYPWSSRYAYAKSTYRDPQSTIAVFNSQLLADYFRGSGMHFPEQYVYEPMLHPRLRQKRVEARDFCKDRLILVYGRPSMPRNAFELIAEALRLWAKNFPSAHEWSLVSAGEPHADVPLGAQVVLQSRGKLTLDEYARHLSRCWVGISLMLSPHPSYPPLEMAEYGAWVITNKFENKNLSELVGNIISVDEPTPEVVAERLAWCCSQYQPDKTAVIANLTPAFRSEEDEFPFVQTLVNSWRHA